MAMQHQFRAIADQDINKFLAVDQAFAPFYRAGNGWVMNQDNPQESLLAGFPEQRLKSGQLHPAEAADREEGEAGSCRTKADQGDLATNSQAREKVRGLWDILLTVRGQVRRPHGAGLDPGTARVGFMVAGDDGDPVRGSQGFQPLPGFGKLAWQADMGQVAGHGNMVGTGDAQVIKQRFNDIETMDDPSPAPPGQVSQDALAEQLGGPCTRQRGQVKIGDVRQGEARPRDRLTSAREQLQ